MIRWQSVHLVEETIVFGEYHRLDSSHRQIVSHNKVHLATYENKQITNLTVCCCIKYTLPRVTIKISNWEVIYLMHVELTKQFLLKYETIILELQNVSTKQHFIIVCPCNHDYRERLYLHYVINSFKFSVK